MAKLLCGPRRCCAVQRKMEGYGLGHYGGYCAVIGGILIHLTLGNLYSFGNMQTYIASYMHQRVSDHVTYSNTIWVNAFTTSAQGFFMVCGGLLEQLFGPRIPCFIGCLLYSSGILLTYYTIDMSLIAVMLTYGLLAGIGIALAYSVPLSCGMKWYPSRKGQVNGLIVGGFGLGALGSTIFQTQYLNPHNKPPNRSTGYFTDDEILDRLPSLFIALGSVFLIMEFLGCILINKPSQDKQEEESLLERYEVVEEELKREERGNEVPDVNRKSLKPQEVIFKSVFYIFWFIYFFNTIAIGYINAMYKSFGQTFIGNDHFLAVVGSVAAIFNAGGRYFWGLLMDYTSFRIAMRLLCFFLMILFLTFPLTQYMGKIGFAFWVWVIFFTFSGTFVLMPTVVEKAFGAQYYCANYGLLFISQAGAGPLIAVFNNLLLETLGYSGFFLIVSFLLSISVLLTFFVPDDL